MNEPDADEKDAQDMARLAAGHDAALNDLMLRHAEKLHRFLFRSLQNEEDAADLAQETFVKVYLHRRRFNSKHKFSAWLYTLAGNLVRDRYRWRSRHPQVSLNTEREASGKSFLDALSGSGALPNESLQAEERAVAVQQAVAALPEDLRQPLILAEYEELSHADIGQILRCSPKAVETRIYRARRQLRSSLSRMLETA